MIKDFTKSRIHETLVINNDVGVVGVLQETKITEAYIDLKFKVYERHVHELADITIRLNYIHETSKLDEALKEYAVTQPIERKRLDLDNMLLIMDDNDRTGVMEYLLDKGLKSSMLDFVKNHISSIKS
jgi:hypothetical protein